MNDFTALFVRLDRADQAGGKIEALAGYFQRAAPEDAAWALALLLGRGPRRAVPPRELLAWAAQYGGWPQWLVAESYRRVGDLAETIALLVCRPGRGTDLPLHRMVRERLLPLGGLAGAERKRRVFDMWSRLAPEQCLVWNRLLTGGLRSGVSRALLAQALAEAAGVPAAVVAYRIAGEWQPSGEEYRRLVRAQGSDGPGQPYPFLVAPPLSSAPERLGPPGDWLAEWDRGGIRAQLIARCGQRLIWSHEEEWVTDQYPELAAAAAALPDGTVLDGEIVARRAGAPPPAGGPRRRNGRERAGSKPPREAPAAFVAFDILEQASEDVRSVPLCTRRQRLAALLESAGLGDVLRISPVIAFASWDELTAVRARARGLGALGVRLKRRDSACEFGQSAGDWWTWRAEPLRIHAVLTYAQPGAGEQTGLYTDCTFGVWHGERLVTIARASSRLSRRETRELDAFVRSHTRERFGPVRKVAQELVFELAFDEIRPSSRHHSGVAVRAARIDRWCRDRPIATADTLDRVRALLRPGDDHVLPAK